MTKPAFGWHRDNTIGLSPQPNGWLPTWLEFYRERRLRFQLELATANGFGPLLEPGGERLLEALPVLLSGHSPQPSLLHGDLWGGNWLAGAGGVPFIFDPAVYYGDREADIAMTQPVRRIRPEFLSRLRSRVAARSRASRAARAIQPVSRAQSREPVRRRIREAGARDDRAPGSPKPAGD